MDDAALAPLLAEHASIGTLLLGDNLIISQVTTTKLVADGRVSLLRHLDLRRNLKLTAVNLKILFAACTTLTKVGLNGVKHLDDSVVETIAASCTGLTAIDLSSCNITDASLRSLLPRDLRDVSLKGCGVSQGAVIELIRGCPTLHSLNLHGCTRKMGVTVLSALEGLPQLLSVRGSFGGYGGAALNDAVMKLLVKHATTLKIFRVSGLAPDKAATSRLLQLIANCTNLQEVDLKFAEEDAAGMSKAVSQLHELRKLHGTGDADDVLFPVLAANCPMLEDLNVPTHKSREQVQMVCGLASSFSGLRNITMPCLVGIPGAYHELFSSATQLEELHFEGVQNKALAEVLPIAATTINPGLQVFTLSCLNASIGDFGICSAEGGENLRKELQAFTDLVARCSTNLRIVDIHKGGKIGRGQIAALAKCSCLQSLSTCSGGDGITRDDFRQLVRACPRLAKAPTPDNKCVISIHQFGTDSASNSDICIVQSR